jgi:GH15 family glucan-1,4-alpha-glucosidase
MVNESKEKRHQYRLGIIGNCSYMAHIDDQARVAWLCWPRFDSSFVFGRLLDPEKGGEFSIITQETLISSEQRYIENTNVLQTELKASDGILRVTDFAPRFRRYERPFRPLMLIRKLETLEGDPKVKIVCHPKGDYGKTSPDIYLASNHIRYSGLEGTVRLWSNISLHYIASEKYQSVSEPTYLLLTWGLPLEGRLESTLEEYLRETIDYWQTWVRHCSIGKFYQDQVIRSALVLKIHQFEDTGAIIASGTTSLPESPGSGRNWDYRYCWLRDTYYTLMAFNQLAHFDEMEGFARFVENIAISETGRYSPLYDIVGNPHAPEEIMSLKGYLGNQPVRVGNAAVDHIQNDVYGQILLALLPLYIDRRFPKQFRTTSRKLIGRLLDAIDQTIEEPDASLWEFREFSVYHCYTYLFHWAGSKAAVKMGQALGDHEMVRRARRLVARSARKVEACYDPKRKCYTQGIGRKELDASTLQLIAMSYLDPASERAKNHLLAIEKELGCGGGLIFRYTHLDDFGKPEIAFLVCGFWYVEALTLAGRVDDAIHAFESLLKHSNHLGLLSEDVLPANESQWGNFPQTYSHVGLINAAFRISDSLGYPDFF